MSESYFIGVDVGTQGARVVMLDAEGTVVGSGDEEFPLSDVSREEQSPTLWWEVCLRLLKALIRNAATSVNTDRVVGIAVTSTSGTVIPLGKNMEPLHSAIMYSDKRSAEEGKLCRELAMQFHSTGYTGFNASSGLSKMVWFSRHFPDKAKKIASWTHASDFIMARLSGAWGITDYTNALKSGFDLSRKCWPSWLSEKLPLKQEWLPGVVPSGTPVGNLSASLCAALGLPAAVKVVAGMTDGCASQVASGAVKPGDWNTTIGTTLVIKGVTRNELTDPEGRFYSHRHPDGLWMPGGASNTGADWIAGEFSDDLAALNEQARSLIPTGHLVYPLQQQGERFPFIAPDARGFHPSGLSRGERFAASMEGVAYIERYAYELVQSLSSEKVKCVFTAGGGSNSDTWLIIRSNVMNLPVYKMRNVSGAIGAAIIAAAQTHFNTLSSAATAMTQIEKKFLPDRRLAQQYETSYRRFVELLSQKGYINKMQSHA